MTSATPIARRFAAGARTRSFYEASRASALLHDNGRVGERQRVVPLLDRDATVQVEGVREQLAVATTRRATAQQNIVLRCKDRAVDPDRASALDLDHVAAVTNHVRAGLRVAAGGELAGVAEVPGRLGMVRIDPDRDVMVLRARGEVNVARTSHLQRVVAAAAVGLLAVALCVVGQIVAVVVTATRPEDQQHPKVAVRRAMVASQAADALGRGNSRIASREVDRYRVAVA